MIVSHRGAEQGLDAVERHEELRIMLDRLIKQTRSPSEQGSKLNDHQRRIFQRKLNVL